MKLVIAFLLLNTALAAVMSISSERKTKKATATEISMVYSQLITETIRAEKSGYYTREEAIALINLYSRKSDEAQRR